MHTPGRHVQDRAAAAGQRAERRAHRALDQRQPRMRVRPAAQRRLEDHRATLAGQQQCAAAGAREVHGQRGGGADRGVEVLLDRGAARVQQDERPRVGLGAQAALHHPRAARHRRPEDPRRGRALAQLAQAVEVDLGGDVRPRPPGAGDPGAVAAGRDRAHRLDPRQHEQLGVRAPGRCPAGLARPNGSRTTTRGPASSLRPRRVKRALMRMRVVRLPGRQRRRAPAAAGPRAGPSGRSARPARTVMSIGTGSSSSARRAPTTRDDRDAARARDHPPGAPSRPG